MGALRLRVVDRFLAVPAPSVLRPPKSDIDDTCVFQVRYAGGQRRGGGRRVIDPVRFAAALVRVAFGFPAVAVEFVRGLLAVVRLQLAGMRSVAQERY